MHYLGTVSSKYHPAVAMPGEGEGWRGGGNCQPGLTSDLKMNGQNPGIRAPGTTGSSCSRLQHNINKQLEIQKLWLILIQFHTLVSPLASLHAIRTCNVKLVKWWPTQITLIVCFRPWKSIKWVLTISIGGTLSSVQQLFSLSWRRWYVSHNGSLWMVLQYLSMLSEYFWIYFLLFKVQQWRGSKYIQSGALPYSTETVICK